MPAVVTTTTPLLIAFAPLVLWRIGVRFRRQIGRQRSTALRHRIHVCLYVALLAWVATVSHQHGAPVAYLAIGTAGGAALAQYGLRVTRFEPTHQGLFYTPKAWLGVTLSLLFVGRLAYRLIELQGSDAGMGATPAAWASAGTLALFGLLAAYNACYALGVMRWRRRVIDAARARSAV